LSARKRPALWACSPSTRALALERLAESGLSEADAETLGIEALDGTAVARLAPNFENRPALKLPYFARDGKALTAFPSWPAFFRVRYLGDPPPSFSDQTTEKPKRYAQPSETGVCAYLPQSLDWDAIAKDVAHPIVITEGELKAACACAHGYATIGVGGVWSWRSAELGVPFLPELAEFKWLRRKVYLVFDSDFRTNKNVCLALQALAEELARRGAIPFMAAIPEMGEPNEEGIPKKTGLDDFLVECDNDGFDQVLREAQPLTLARVLWGLNEEVVYVRDPGLVVIRETRQRISTDNFGGVAFAARPYSIRVLNEDGTYALKSAAAPASWLRWCARAEVERMTYAPGGGTEVEIGDTTMLNLWRGWGCEPKKGSVAPWKELLDHLFQHAKNGERAYFERWAACPIQQPGTKMQIYALIHGKETGTGKSTVAYALGRIYGRNFSEIKQDDIHAGFNEWAENKQLVLVDDVSGALKRQEADTIKKMITQKTLRVNVKYLPSYEVNDVLNYYFTSNHADALLLEDDDRRCFVWEAEVGKLPNAFYTRFWKWLDHEGGKEALFYHLLNLDMGDFDPYAYAMRTGARMRMILDGKSELGSWVAALRGDPTGILRLGEAEIPGELFTADELRDIYDPERRTSVTGPGMARELKRAGFFTVCEDAPFRDGRQRLQRFYVVRNPEPWIEAKLEAVERHLAKRYGRSVPIFKKGRLVK
jgi:hypothetical protein